MTERRVRRGRGSRPPTPPPPRRTVAAVCAVMAVSGPVAHADGTDPWAVFEASCLTPMLQATPPTPPGMEKVLPVPDWANGAVFHDPASGLVLALGGTDGRDACTGLVPGDPAALDAGFSRWQIRMTTATGTQRALFQPLAPEAGPTGEAVFETDGWREPRVRVSRSAGRAFPAGAILVWETDLEA